MNLDTKRKYELEVALEGVNLPRCYKDELSENTKIELLRYIMDTGLPVEEVNYLIQAYYMPIEDILNDIEIYRVINPKSQQSFILKMCKKYSAKPATILHRINEVRTIKMYKNNIKKLTKKR